jgi:hypothetical protein
MKRDRGFITLNLFLIRWSLAMQTKGFSRYLSSAPALAVLSISVVFTLFIGLRLTYCTWDNKPFTTRPQILAGGLNGD